MTVFSLVASACLLVAPSLPRTYHVAATVELTDRTAADAALAAAIPASPVAEDIRAEARKVPSTAIGPNDLRIVSRTLDGGRSQVTVSARTSDRDGGLAMLRATLDNFVRQRRWMGDDAVLKARQVLVQESTARARERRAADEAVEVYRVANAGALPEDRAAAAARLEKTVAKLEERQRRLDFVVAAIGRLEEQRNRRSSDAPRRPEAPAAPGVPATAASDPEVVQLRAQLTLLNEQLDKQLGEMGRTEQHPYVEDLRKQQEALQKKLDAAVARASAGKPPPESAVRPPERDPAAAFAAQTFDVQLAQLYAERDQLDPEVHVLKAQRQKEQREVDAFAPRQHDFARLLETQKKAAAAADAAAGRLAAFDGVFPARSSRRALDAGEIELGGAGSLPVWPTFPVVAAIALAAGLVSSLAAGSVAEALDPRFRSPREFAHLVPVPVLGVVGEIRTAARKSTTQLWRQFGRPLTAAVLIAVVVASAAWSALSLRASPRAATALGRAGTPALSLLPSHATLEQ